MHPIMHLDPDRTTPHQLPSLLMALCRCSPSLQPSLSPSGGSNSLTPFNSSGTNGRIAGRKSVTMRAPSYFAASRCANHQKTSSSTPGATAISSWKSRLIHDSAYRRIEQTALVPHSPLGWAEISHPFHPLRGRRFEVLKKRRVAGVDTLILRELERGTFSVPRESTDWADPSPYDSLTLPPHRLAADCLFELVALLDALRPAPPPPEKTCKKELTKEMLDATVRPVVNVVR